MWSTSSQTFSTRTYSNVDVSGTLIYFLHKVPVLLKLFFEWIAMTNNEKTIFNLQIMQSFSWDKHHLCTSVVKAFNYWDIVQDTEGAPGFTENPYQCELSYEITTDLKNIIKAMTQLTEQMITKRKMNENFLRTIELKSNSKIMKRALNGSGEHFS